MKILSLNVRLCRLMCGKAMPFRASVKIVCEATPPETSMRRGLAKLKIYFTERQSLSAHQAAKPRVFTYSFMSPEGAIIHV